MQGPMGGTAEIVIPTGRNGFCCVVPCALMVALEAGAGAAGLLIARHLARRATTRMIGRSLRRAPAPGGDPAAAGRATAREESPTVRP